MTYFAEPLAAHLPASAASSTLLGLIYEGLSEAVPWHDFAEALRIALAARNVIITLHHVNNDGSDVYVMASIPGDEVDWAAVEATYRTEFMDNDPLRPSSMEPGQINVIGPATAGTRKHRFLQDIGLSQSLRLCVAEPGGVRCWVDVIRSSESPDPCFSPADMALLRELMPHMTRAVGLYARLKRQEIEKTIYESMVDHFALGCILLNDQREVLHINRVASSIIADWPGISVSQNRLSLAERGAQAELNQAISAVMAARAESRPLQGGELVRLGDCQSKLLGLLVYPAPLLHYYQGGQAPCAVVYLSDLTASLDALRPTQSHSLSRIGQLFRLTRQESTLALLLAYGNTIAQAAQEMGIAEIAARNYSKKIYSKMGIASQADLIRLVLRSISVLR